MSELVDPKSEVGTVSLSNDRRSHEIRWAKQNGGRNTENYRVDC